MRTTPKKQSKKIKKSLFSNSGKDDIHIDLGDIAENLSLIETLSISLSHVFLLLYIHI